MSPESELQRAVLRYVEHKLVNASEDLAELVLNVANLAHKVLTDKRKSTPTGGRVSTPAFDDPFSSLETAQTLLTLPTNGQTAKVRKATDAPAMHHGYQDYSVISSVSTSLEGLLDNEALLDVGACFASQETFVNYASPSFSLPAQNPVIPLPTNAALIPQTSMTPLPVHTSLSSLPCPPDLDPPFALTSLADPAIDIVSPAPISRSLSRSLSPAQDLNHQGPTDNPFNSRTEDAPKPTEQEFNYSSSIEFPNGSIIEKRTCDKL
ncbi:hypothetical protein BGZ97_009866, partial [Linnemannia gamsii]